MAAKTLAQSAPDRGLSAVNDHRNEVILVGRVTAAAQERELPSGDVLVSWRIVVDRPAVPAVPGRRTPLVDALDCVSSRKAISRSALGWQVGDTVEVCGALRRRFWRGTGGPANRTEVEVLRARRLARAG